MSEEAARMIGAAGCSGAAPPERIARYHRAINSLVEEYDSNKITAEKFKERLREVEQP